ncbi:MAG: Hpt domain-containing protein, partial [Nitrosospira sp.]
MKKLLATFRIEADGHLQAMSSGLLALKKIPVGQQLADIVERIFLDAHSLKGAARAVNLTQIEAVCQSLENVFFALKDKRLPVSSPLIDLLLQTIDALGGLLTADNSVAGAQKLRVGTLIRQLDDALREPLSEFGDSALAPQTAPPIPPATMPPADVPAESDKSMQMLTSTPGLASTTVRVSATKLDAVMRQVEELLLPRLAVNQRAKELSEAAAMLAAWKKQRLHIQPALRLVDREFARNIKDSSASRRKHELPRLLKYLDAEQLHMKMLEDRLARLQQTAEQDQRTLAGMTDSLRHDVKEMQLLPFSSLLDILP